MLDSKRIFEEVRSHCLGKEGCVEDYPWEHHAWKLKGKIFAIGSQDSEVVTVKSTPDRQIMLIMHPQIGVASHVGRYGWVTVTINDEDTLALTKDLIDEGYELLQRKPTKKK